MTADLAWLKRLLRTAVFPATKVADDILLFGTALKFRRGFNNRQLMILLVMGVAGSGKTTIGRMLAERLGWAYLEADDFHSAANKEKMHGGIPLTDADRLPWLEAIHAELCTQNAKGDNVVLACSALREEYRKILMRGLQMELIYLRGSQELIASRLRQRTHHFAGEAILDDQFAVLEEPQNAVVVDIGESPDEIVEQILRKIR